MKTIKLIFLALLTSAAFAQQKSPAKPKLVIGIVVDQMRYDYLFRYAEKYGNGGFKRLMQQGFLCKNTNYNYVPTYTAPGHSAIYTGTTPAINGIVGNEWYVREWGKETYCADDSTVQTIGSTSTAGKMSPHNLLTTTITDELRLANNKQSRTIGIALKDRSAIMPVGHMGNAAYWFDGASGNWITSSYYMNDLPEWLKKLNAEQQAASYLKQSWNTLLPVTAYTESTADDMPFEGTYTKESKPVFPYDLAKLNKKGFDIIRTTPFGNTITKNLAIEVLKNEQLGKGKATDFLAISFSSTDYVGHQFGPNSIETEDTYLRLDKDLAELLTFLDTYIGKQNVLVFLTADHGAALVPDYLTQQKVPAGVFNGNAAVDSLKHYLNAEYGNGEWVKFYTNQQVYLNHDLIIAKRVNKEEMEDKAANFLIGFKGVANVITATILQKTEFTKSIENKIENGFNSKRSGDVIITLEPAWFEGRNKGTTHGEAYGYDTHVPLLWYGGTIKNGSSVSPVSITDIAPTIAQMLDIESPNGCIGVPVEALFK